MNRSIIVYSLSAIAAFVFCIMLAIVYGQLVNSAIAQLRAAMNPTCINQLHAEPVNSNRSIADICRNSKR